MTAAEIRTQLVAAMERASQEILHCFDAAVAGLPTPPSPQPDPIPPQVPAGTRIIDVPWNGDDSTPDRRTWTANHGGWQDGETLAFRFTTGPQQTDGRGIPNISLTVADGGAPAPRQAAISLEPGDFDRPIFTNMMRAETFGGGDTSTIFFGVGNAPPYTPYLQPGTTYYFNVRYTGAHGGNGRVYIAKPGYLT